jgi:hypothetical protein
MAGACLQGTGEDDEDVESSSATLVQTEEGFAPVFFNPRPLKNLLLIDELSSLMPLTDMQVANLTNEEIPQIYCLTGRCVGRRVVRQGSHLCKLIQPASWSCNHPAAWHDTPPNASTLALPWWRTTYQDQSAPAGMPYACIQLHVGHGSCGTPKHALPGFCRMRRGPRAALSVLRPGLAVTELAVSPLPGNPTAVFTVRRAPDDEQDGYIVVSFSNATLVFEIGDEVKETSDSGFLGTVATLHTQLLEDGSMLQVGGGGLLWWGGG